MKYTVTQILEALDDEVLEEGLGSAAKTAWRKFKRSLARLKSAARRAVGLEITTPSGTALYISNKKIAKQMALALNYWVGAAVLVIRNQTAAADHQQVSMSLYKQGANAVGKIVAPYVNSQEAFQRVMDSLLNQALDSFQETQSFRGAYVVVRDGRRNPNAVMYGVMWNKNARSKYL